MHVAIKVSGLLLVAVMLIGCGLATSVVPIHEALIEADDTTVRLVVGACATEWTTSVLEDSERVTIEVTARTKSGDCGFEDVVELSSPLGNRVIVDASNGEPVKTTRR